MTPAIIESPGYYAEYDPEELSGGEGGATLIFDSSGFTAHGIFEHPLAVLRQYRSQVKLSVRYTDEAVAAASPEDGVVGWNMYGRVHPNAPWLVLATNILGADKNTRVRRENANLIPYVPFIKLEATKGDSLATDYALVTIEMLPYN